MHKKILIISIIASLLTACGSGTSDKSTNNNIQPDSKKAPDLQALLDTAINSKDAKDAGITGIPLTFQCDGLYNNQPVSIASGKISNKPNAKELPVDAIFQDGSITKTFVSVLALKLADDINSKGEKYFGDKGLNSTVGEILHNPQPSNSWNSDWNNVTLKQLLNMTSGIPDYLNDTYSEVLFNSSKYPYHQFTIDEILASVAMKPLLFSPGHGWYYSNTAYVIMNKIISYVTKSNINDQIKKYITTPLNLQFTYYVDNILADTINKNQIPLLMSGYLYQQGIAISLPASNFYAGVDITPYSLSWANTAGSMISNTADLNTFARVLFHGKFLTEDQLKEFTSLVAMKDDAKYKAGDNITNGLDSTTREAFGLGLMAMYITLPNSTNEVVYHYMGVPMGFVSEWMYFKNEHASLSYSINSTNIDQVNKVGFKLYDVLFKKIATECISR